MEKEARNLLFLSLHITPVIVIWNNYKGFKTEQPSLWHEWNFMFQKLYFNIKSCGEVIFLPPTKDAVKFSSLLLIPKKMNYKTVK